MIEALVSGLLEVFSFPTSVVMLLGIAVEFEVGIGSLVAMALMLPFIFDMKVVQAFAFLLGMYAVTRPPGYYLGPVRLAQRSRLSCDDHRRTSNGQARRGGAGLNV
jgi:hypothetical protein